MDLSTINEYRIEKIKTAFVSSLINKDEENAIWWGYEIYYSGLQFEIFYLLNEIYNMFYIEKHAEYFNGYLQTLAKEWEASNRKNHTILGSIIKNLVSLDISITDMIRNKTSNHNNNISIVNYDNSWSSANFTEETKNFKCMSSEEVVKLKQKIKREEKNVKSKKQFPSKIMIPTYVCELFDLKVNNEDLSLYIPFDDWCKLHERNSISQTVILRRRRRRSLNN